MDVIEALNSRYSCRAYTSRPVSEQVLLEVLEEAIRAPSWANTQPWEIYAAGGEATERIRRAYLDNLDKDVPGNPDVARPQEWPAALEERTSQLMAERTRHLGIAREDSGGRQAMQRANYRLFDAPVVIYLCMDRSLTAWSMFDLGSLAQSIMLAAKDHGLDTIPAFMLTMYPQVVRAELRIPDGLSIVIGIALGYGDIENPANTFRSSRRSLSDVARLRGF